MNKDITISEANKERKKLEDTIQLAIDDFHYKTGAHFIVDEISLNNNEIRLASGEKIKVKSFIKIELKIGD
jgi:hypothetical protein